MKLKTLLENIENIKVYGSKEKEIFSLCNDSRKGAPGGLFFAKKGKVYDGQAFIPKAINAGCVAVVTDLFNPFIKGVTQIVCTNMQALEGIIAARFYQNPSKKLQVIGVTGTNGKTTTSYLIRHILETAGIVTGLMGTVETIIGEVRIPAKKTTEDLLTNQKTLTEMAKAGCSACVMEVSSHGLDQGRVQGIEFTVAVFTNLTQEHLDYHGSMEEYAKAKARLFTQARHMVMNSDSIWSPFMLQGKEGALLYGLTDKSALYAKNPEYTLSGIRALCIYQGEEEILESPLIGEFNLYNCLASIGAAMQVGISFKEAVKACKTFSLVPGRMEKIEGNKSIFVDYAHTPDALERALITLRALTSGRVFCLFGCGGERDKEKRPQMGKIAQELADLVFITSDNPRGESPEGIISDILRGIVDKEKITVEIDRKKAIIDAIERLGENDTLLIAGKGHESRQIFGAHSTHFDDRIVAKEVLSVPSL